MSTAEAKIIARRFARLLKDKKFPLASVYLFGSYVRGDFHKWSDIDVAVVSTLSKYSERKAISLMFLKGEIDERIEPHYFISSEFKDECNFFACEIRKTGIKVM
jgi:predicted nucleotidyltransferase